MREIIGVDMEVSAFYDGENIAKLKLVGWGSGFEDDADVVIINQSSEEHEMIMLDDSRKPHSGELVFKQSSVNGHLIRCLLLVIKFLTNLLLLQVLQR